jgi:predicted nucleic-acid-binding protein
VIGLDTNVIARYLTRDDETQWKQASQLIQSGEQCFIANIVLCEMVWVLQGNPYKYGKTEILSTLETMLHAPTLEFENRSAVYQALQKTKQGRADFSDYLIGAIARQSGCTETATLDCLVD